MLAAIQGSLERPASMQSRSLSLIAVLGAAVLLQPQPGTLRAQARTESQTALNGRVSSTEDGPLEGALVSAKKADSTITVTVVSDENGRYRFPQSRLEPGHYTLQIRAVG